MEAKDYYELIRRARALNPGGISMGYPFIGVSKEKLIALLDLAYTLKLEDETDES